jgi:hypothetical protein
VIALLLALTSSGSSLAQQTAGANPVPFPAGYDFPVPAGVLEKMVSAGYVAGLRRHGWYLWAGINQSSIKNDNGSWPIWRTWPIATQVFSVNGAATQGLGNISTAKFGGRSLRDINVANNPEINLALPFYLIPAPVRAKHAQALANITLAANIPDGANFQNNGDLMLVSEAYAPPAYKTIRGLHLNRGQKLNALLAANKPDTPPVDRQSIVLKHMYWPVKKSGMTALPVYDMKGYDQSANPDTTYVGFENAARWTDAVAIDPTRTVIPPGETASVTYLYDVLQSAPGTNGIPPPPLGPVTYQKAQVVPITDFYFKQISQQDYNALSTYDQVLLDAAFYWVTKRLFEPGDYVVSVASHVITKEMPSWTLQTAWWHPNPDQSPYAADRPAILAAQGPWRHYLLASEYGITATPGGSLPIAYNPYIELASHPVATNCRNCHIRATWPQGCYITKTGPDSLANIQPGNSIFAHLLRTDFLWTITDRAFPRPPPSPNTCQ